MALRHDLLSYNVKRTTAHTGSPVARSRDPDPPQTDALRWMCKASSVRADALRTHSAQSGRRGAVRRASGPGPPAVTARGESASQPPRDYRPHLCVGTNTRQQHRSAGGGLGFPPATSPRRTAALLKARLLCPPPPGFPTGPALDVVWSPLPGPERSLLTHATSQTSPPHPSTEDDVPYDKASAWTICSVVAVIMNNYWILYRRGNRLAG